VIDELRHIAPRQGFAFIDGDTSMSPGTWEAMLRGMGGAVAATDAVLAGTCDNAFVAIRPPGHPAEIGKPLGFCFFDNAAIAARHAQRKHGIGRVAIVDFDVHHGNGTQEIFWADPTVMYCSTHHALYPGPARAPSAASTTPSSTRREVRRQRPRISRGLRRPILPRSRLRAGTGYRVRGFDAHYRDPLATPTLRAGFRLGKRR